LRSFHALFKFLYCAAINELDSGHPFAAGMAVSLTLRTRTARVADNFNGCVDDIEIAFEHILNESLAVLIVVETLDAKLAFQKLLREDLPQRMHASATNHCLSISLKS
jgi:hypothetical protein